MNVITIACCLSTLMVSLGLSVTLFLGPRGPLRVPLIPVLPSSVRSQTFFSAIFFFPPKWCLAHPKRMNFRKSSEGVRDFGYEFRKNFAIWFSENEGWGGSKTVWNFSENSSVLDVSGIPKSQQPVCKAVAVDHGDKNLLSQDPTGTLTRCWSSLSFLPPPRLPL